LRNFAFKQNYKMNNLSNTYNKYLSLIQGDTFDFDKFNQYAIVHHSIAIEGSTLTKAETFLLLDEQLTPKNKPLEHTLMAIDHLNALKFVMDLANSKKPLTEEILKKIASLVLKQTGSEISAIGGTFDSSKGDYRKVNVRAGVSTFINFQKVPERVHELLIYINDTIQKARNFDDINELAFDVYFQLVSIHPFADGNGRVSRLLMNYVQQYHNVPLSVIYKEDKQEYFNALVTTRTEEDISIFRKFMFLQTEKYLLEKIEELSKKQVTKKSEENKMSFLF